MHVDLSIKVVCVFVHIKFYTCFEVQLTYASKKQRTLLLSFNTSHYRSRQFHQKLRQLCCFLTRCKRRDKRAE